MSKPTASTHIEASARPASAPTAIIQAYGGRLARCARINSVSDRRGCEVTDRIHSPLTIRSDNYYTAIGDPELDAQLIRTLRLIYAATYAGTSLTVISGPTLTKPDPDYTATLSNVTKYGAPHQ